MTGEGLGVGDRLCCGAEAGFQRRYYQVGRPARFPFPVQQPRIPIWVGRNSARALRRAARWDGWLADTAGEQEMSMAPETPAEHRRRLHECREHERIDVIVSGYSEPGSDAAQPYMAAGATSWLESGNDRRAGPEVIMRRVAAGPNR